MNTAAGGATVDHRDGGARRVIESAFELLELVHTLEPVRLVELTEKAGMPRATVHRMLAQLIAVGAVCRDGAHYCLGASLLRLGAAVGPQRRLRHAARRPIAELAAATGAAVSLSGRIGDDLLFVDAVQARNELPITTEVGAAVPPYTAQARAHVEFARTTPIVDAGGTVADLCCVAIAVPFGGDGFAALATVVHAPRPPQGLLAATRATAARVAAALRES